MKKIKVMTIGGATLDTIIEYKDMETMLIQKRNIAHSYLLLEEGAKIEVLAQKCFSGGGATNTAVSFKKLGFDVTFFGKVGKDITGKTIINELQSYEIDVSQVRYSDSYGTATSYVVPSLKGDRTIFAYRGANTNLITEDIPHDMIKEVDFVYITSLSRTSAARMPEIVKSANKQNTKVAINPGSSQLELGDGFIKESLEYIDILILNYEEAKTLMLSLLSTQEIKVEISKNKKDENLLESHPEYQDATFTLREFFKIILKLGPRIVVVTNGANGVYVATPEKLYFHESINANKIINTLGAGDAFGSSFCAAIYSGENIDTAIKRGLINSYSVIKHHDAKSGLMNLAEIQEEIKTFKSHLKAMDW